MSAARPVARSLLARATAPSPTLRICSSTSTSQFHSSAHLSARKRPTTARQPKSDAAAAAIMFPERSQKQLDQFAARYNAEQLQAIQAGDQTIDTKELAATGRLRVDSFRMPYLDDFSDIQPIIDKRARRAPPPDPTARFMAMDEFMDDLVAWADELPKGPPTGTLKRLHDFVEDKYRKVHERGWPKEVREKAMDKYKAYRDQVVARAHAAGAGEGGPTDADVLTYLLERSSMTDRNAPGNSEVAPGLPSQVPGVAGLYKRAIDPEDEGLDDEGIYQDLKKRTGMSVREILGLNVKLFKARWVSNQTRLGKVRSTSLTCIAGNGNGWLGVGQAKSVEPMIASRQAMLYAIQNMRPIRRYENRTIYGNIEAKISGTVVRLYARPPGFGLRVPHHIFEIARAAGIRDLACKIPRSRSIMNSVKATFEALLNQPDPEQLAMGRGKKLVDARKVYYGGNVY
ncbi:hypothetical protein QBC47DRAFT_369987 [Echria macrotheca]|uniref:S5 DRBM domain-containing protein n=1 Tax=Echria macrotheca TaxID=438768 RepID=A0AAJ0BNG4_9PEZI|nr:hypothetical protein QBC47DRAFT_369987 [Echria macrotheca]